MNEANKSMPNGVAQWAYANDDSVWLADIEYGFKDGSFVAIKCKKTAGGTIAVPAAIHGVPVIAIGEGAFKGCAGLTRIDLPEGLQEIGKESFANCAALEEITVPGSITKIGGSAFFRCKALKAFRIPQGVTKIQGFTFNQCETLEEIDIPEGVEEIGPFAFDHCRSLRQIGLPKSLRKCYCDFENCSNLDVRPFLLARKSGLEMYGSFFKELFRRWEIVASLSIKKCPPALLRRMAEERCAPERGEAFVKIAANADRSVFVAELKETETVTWIEPDMVDIEEVYSPMEIKSMNGGYTGFDVPNPRAGQVQTQVNQTTRYCQVYAEDIQGLVLEKPEKPTVPETFATEQKADPEVRETSAKTGNESVHGQDGGSLSAVEVPKLQTEAGPSKNQPTSPPLEKKGLFQRLFGWLFLNRPPKASK